LTGDAAGQFSFSYNHPFPNFDILIKKALMKKIMILVVLGAFQLTLRRNPIAGSSA
jgi:hypothetical protein